MFVVTLLLAILRDLRRKDNMSSSWKGPNGQNKNSSWKAGLVDYSRWSVCPVFWSCYDDDMLPFSLKKISEHSLHCSFSIIFFSHKKEHCNGFLLTKGGLNVKERKALGEEGGG
jgi:hypothetical protein